MVTVQIFKSKGLNLRPNLYSLEFSKSTGLHNYLGVRNVGKEGIYDGSEVSSGRILGCWIHSPIMVV